MNRYQNAKQNAVVSAIGLASLVVLIVAADWLSPWMRAALGGVAFLLAVKIVVALRASVPSVSHFEENLRRLAFVDSARVTRR